MPKPRTKEAIMFGKALPRWRKQRPQSCQATWSFLFPGQLLDRVEGLGRRFEAFHRPRQQVEAGQIVFALGVVEEGIEQAAGIGPLAGFKMR